jgi:hypothetical protein
MQSNAALLVAGAVGLAAVVGVTYAATTRQADRPAALPEVSISLLPPSAFRQSPLDCQPASRHTRPNGTAPVSADRTCRHCSKCGCISPSGNLHRYQRHSR